MGGFGISLRGISLLLISAIVSATTARLLEDNTPRLLEDGTPRILES